MEEYSAEDEIVNEHSTDPSPIRINRRGAIYRESTKFLCETVRALQDYFLFSAVDDQRVILQPVPFHTNVSCWCSAQVKEYLDFSTSLANDLKVRGARLIDGHPWNFMFYNTKLKFVDFGSVQSGNDDSWFWAEREHYSPLQFFFYVTYCGKLRRRLAENVHEPAPIQPEEILRLGLLGLSDNDCHTSHSERFARITNSRDHQRLGRWIGYRDAKKDLPTNLAEDPRIPAIARLIASERGLKTAIDIGANDGIHSMLCASKGLQVLSLEIEDASASSLFELAKARNAAITVACSTLEDYTYHLRFIPKVFRPKADLAILLAVTHHLVHDFGYDFDKLFEELSVLSAKCVAIEFIDYEDVFLRERLDKRSWYNLDSLIEASNRHHYTTEILDAHEVGRRMLIMRQQH